MQSSKQILIVEDEPAIREMIAYAVTCQGMEPVDADCIEAADRALAQRLPDLILLDWMLPGESGIDYARRLRGGPATCGIPIIMVTARGDERDRVEALEAGVDDYVVKPFSARELAARIRALLRRAQGDDDGEQLSHGALRLDATAHRVYARDTPVAIGPTEYRLLEFLLTNAERVYTRTQLLDRVWGAGACVEERTIDVHIRRLRRTLEPHALDFMVQTVRGTGYRLSTLADGTR